MNREMCGGCVAPLLDEGVNQALELPLLDPCVEQQVPSQVLPVPRLDPPGGLGFPSAEFPFSTSESRKKASRLTGGRAPVVPEVPLGVGLQGHRVDPEHHGRSAGVLSPGSSRRFAKEIYRYRIDVRFARLHTSQLSSERHIGKAEPPG